MAWSHFPVAPVVMMVLLTGCIDESPSITEPPDPLQSLKQDHVRTIAAVLKEAFQLFEERRFDACMARCGYILDLEPDYFPASMLNTLAANAKSDDPEGKNYEFGLVMTWYLGPKEGHLIYDEDKLTYPRLGLSMTHPSPETDLDTSKGNSQNDNE